MAMADEEPRFEVLGPLRAWRGKSEIPLGSPQQRAVLAMLVVRDGAPASIGELVDGLWGEAPPNQAVAALRTYVTRLRAAFGRHSRDRVVVSVSGGYRLAAGLRTDIGDFARKLVEADLARASGEPAAARTALLSALDLWRDEPLAGIPGPYAQAQRARLTEQRLNALETRLEVDLALGRHTEAVAELTGLVRRYPLRERWYGLLMRALHDGGRRADALGVYADLRRVLDRELGCEPGEDLRALHTRLLAGPEPDGPPGSLSVPAQLPADITDFTGRARQAEAVRSALVSGSPVVLSGTGGVGKTTLAVHVAHAVRTHFPGGQLYVDLGGTEHRSATPAAVLADFLHALGVPRARIPASTADRSTLFQSIVDERKVLVLLDNARDVGQIEPLLPDGDGCGVLVTSRAPLAGQVFHTVHLDVLDVEEALALLARVAGERRVTGERPAALEVAAACGFLPLAIRIAGARLASRPAWTVESLAARLAGERRRLRELRVAGLAVETTFDLGYTQSLVDSGLLDEPEAGHYRFHDLVKLCARQRSEAEDGSTERAAALERLFDFALATARNAYRNIEPESVLADRLSRSTAAGLSFSHAKDAYHWVTARRSALAATARRAAENPDCRLLPAADLLLVVSLLIGGDIASTEFGQAALTIARRADEPADPASAARAHLVLGRVALGNGRVHEAEEEYQRALRLSERVDDRPLIAICTLAAGILAVETGRHSEAAETLDEAAAAYRALDDRPGELYALAYRARALLGLGSPEDGLVTAERAVLVSRVAGPVGLAAQTALHQLGTVLAELGRPDDAIEVHRESLHLARELGNTASEAATLVRLAELSLRAGRPAEAMNYAKRGSLASRRIEHPRLKGYALELRRRALTELGQAQQHKPRRVPSRHSAARVRRRHASERDAGLERLGCCGGSEAR
ncbi:BTAD domain-containing putative transcriptional regulator [Amycolatopsis sp. NPDC059027]|uniref:AfsR/SARP family transcriptional regulator n=1 Tax=Amycolatopsis sp. NPDC059027 TaxID=3346709 RepID=UPI00366E4221